MTLSTRIDDANNAEGQTLSQSKRGVSMCVLSLLGHRYTIFISLSDQAVLEFLRLLLMTSPKNPICSTQALILRVKSAKCSSMFYQTLVQTGSKYPGWIKIVLISKNKGKHRYNKSPAHDYVIKIQRNEKCHTSICLSCRKQTYKSLNSTSFLQHSSNVHFRSNKKSSYREIVTKTADH